MNVEESQDEMRTVEVVPHDPAWARRFEEAAGPMRAAFGPDLVALHHIGSTAIPGMPAKPVIDIMPVVRDLERVADAVPALEALGYEPRGEYGIPGRRYFVREAAGSRTHHVHVFERGHPAVIRHLAFRDYLVAHPEEARRYAELKLKLAARHRDERHLYVEGKAPLIAKLQSKAMAWREIMLWSVVVLSGLLGAAAPQDSLRLRFVGNAGFEITDGAATVLVDFPYESGAFGYMTFGVDELRERPDALCLFTHIHADHFSAALLPEVGCTVAGPAPVLAASAAAERMEDASPWRFGGASVTCIDSEHGGVEHCSYLLSWHGRTVFVAGDVDSAMPVLAGVDAVDYLILPFWTAGEVPAIRGRFPGARVVLSHQEPGREPAGCSGCLQLGQGESIVL